MFKSEAEIENSYRDKPSAYLAGFIGGAAFVAIFSILCLFALSVAKDYQHHTIFINTQEWCVNNNGEWMQPLKDDVWICKVGNL